MRDGPILDAKVDGEISPRRELTPPTPAEQAAARKGTIAAASATLQLREERALFGSPGFFKSAAEQLLTSTTHTLELAGNVLIREVDGRQVLVGLQRRSSGSPGRVGINPKWGTVLWHSHPGLRGSLAAFSNEDLEVAQRCQRPLLVIGFGGLSPDVITTLTLPLGKRGFLVSSALKGIMSLEKRGTLQRRLLRLGVAARVCYPSGKVHPVLRTNATPLGHALDDVSFLLDRSVGAMERVGQRAIKGAVKKVVETFSG